MYGIDVLIDKIIDSLIKKNECGTRFENYKML